MSHEARLVSGFDSGLLAFLLGLFIKFIAFDRVEPLRDVGVRV